MNNKQNDLAKDYTDKLGKCGVFSGKKNRVKKAYEKLGVDVGISHVRLRYIDLVLNGSVDERSFTDATYSIAKDGKLFSINNYSFYLEKNKCSEHLELLSLRSKYEFIAKRELEDYGDEDNFNLLLFM